MKKHKTRKQKLLKKSKPKPQQKQLTIAEFFGYEVGKWIWCQHCNRCYQFGEQRHKRDGLQYCHYQDCNGDALIDSATWDTVRHYKPEYPVIPEKNKKYSLNVQLSGVW